jgi:hypothetical protein
MHTANPPKNRRLNYHEIGLRVDPVLLNFSVGLDCSLKNLNPVGDLKTGFRSNRSKFKLQLHHISIW